MKKILLVGDSIRLDYGPYLMQYLGQGFSATGKEGMEEAYKNLDIPAGSNGGDSSMVLEYIISLGQNNFLDFDGFVFNCGLHDVKRKKTDHSFQVGETAYRDNLRTIVHFMKKHQIPTRFINTTPSEFSRYPEEFEFIRYHEDVKHYNVIAEDLMREEQIPVIDLYGFTCSLGLQGDDLYRDHTHFQQKVIQLQAAYLAGVLSAIL